MRITSSEQAQAGAVGSAGEPAAVVALSLVVPIYEVERYLPDLLDSIAAQVPGRYALECIFVDDGSPDRSAGLVERWIETAKPADVTAELVRQRNAGVSAARNRGIAHATGEWIAFPDSDDALDPRYCAEVAEFLLSHGSVATIVATNLVKYIEAEDRLLDNHSLGFKFRSGARTVRLADAPHYLQMHASSTFFRRRDLERSGIRFIKGLHASEDALFVAEVLASAPDPVLGVVPGAVFHYRKRASGDSVVDRYHTKTSTYFDRFDLGYLPLLARLGDDHRRVPEWFQNQLVYELKWLFVAERKPATKAVILTPEQQRAFLERVSAVLAFVDQRLLDDYRVTPLPEEIRQVLLALKGLPRPRPRVELVEAGRSELQLRYVFAGAQPTERFTVRGRDVEPTQAEVRPLDYFGQTLVRERTVRLAATNRVTVRLDGEPQEIRVARLGQGFRALRSGAGRVKRAALARAPRWSGRGLPSPHAR